jgi:hypothetical protein
MVLIIDPENMVEVKMILGSLGDLDIHVPGSDVLVACFPLIFAS